MDWRRNASSSRLAVIRSRPVISRCGWARVSILLYIHSGTPRNKTPSRRYISVPYDVLPSILRLSSALIRLSSRVSYRRRFGFEFVRTSYSEYRWVTFYVEHKTVILPAVAHFKVRLTSEQGRGNRKVRGSKFKHGILTPPPNFLERNIFRYTPTRSLHHNYIIFRNCVFCCH